MPPRSAYQTLLDRVYEDLLDRASSIARSAGIDGAVVNILEYQGTNESFYNVTRGFPAASPQEMLSSNELRVGYEERSILPLAWHRYVRNALLELSVAIEDVFADWERLQSEDNWVPAVFAPELRQLIRSWQRWWREEHRKSRTEEDTPAECWLEFALLLLGLTKQPCETTAAVRAFAEVIYRSLPDGVGESDQLDTDHFLAARVDQPFSWRFSARSDPQGGLRDLLEFLYLVPLHADEKEEALREAFGAPDKQSKLHEFLMSRYPKGLPITAIGGPIQYLGQLQGIVYLAAPWTLGNNFGEEHTGLLREIARDAAPRLYDYRRAAVRRVLLNSAMGESQEKAGPYRLLTLKTPCFLSVSGAALVRLNKRHNLSGGDVLVCKPWQPWNREVASIELGDEKNRQLGEGLSEAARMALVGGESQVGLGSASDTGKMLTRVLASHRLTKSTQFRSVFLVRLGRAEDNAPGVLLLFFREPIERLKDSLHPICLDLEELWELGTVAGKARSLETTLAKIGHVLNRPISLAVDYLEQSSIALEKGDLDRAKDKLFKGLHLAYHARSHAAGARQFFGYARSMETVAERSGLDVILSQYALAIGTSLGAEMKVESSVADYVLSKETDLCGVVLWQLLDNAAYAAGKMPAGLRRVEVRVESTATQRKPKHRIVVENATELTKDDVDRIAVRALSLRRNPSSKSEGCGLGLVYCCQIARSLGGDLRLSIKGHKKRTFVASLGLPDMILTRRNNHG